VAGSCEYDGEPSGSGVTELVSSFTIHHVERYAT
jgi:hypothetical protein